MTWFLWNEWITHRILTDFTEDWHLLSSFWAAHLAGWLAVRGLVAWSRVGPRTANLTLSCRQALSDQSGWACPHLAPRTSLYPEVPYPTSSFPHSALWVCEGEQDGTEGPNSYRLLGNNPLSPLLPNAWRGVLHKLDAQYILIHWDVSFL